MIFDSHTHLQFNSFKNDFNDLVLKLKQNNIYLVNVASSIENSKTSIDLSKKYDFMYSSVGIHPVSVLPQDKLDDNEYETKIENQIIDENFEKLVLNEKVVAIGECGLDFSFFKFLNLSKEKEEEYMQKQISVFEKQVRVAKKYNKTIILHIRDLYAEAINILEKENFKGKAIFHFYKGNAEITQKILKNPN
jgi:TatD DNase family protein